MLRSLHLCAGYAGWSLTLDQIGVDHQTACYVEIDSHAASVLVARMQDGALPPAPIWDDVATFDGLPWRGRVDLITAGFPCQPFSSAGQQLGVDDERWLWPEIARVVAEVEPGIVIVENVPQLRKHGLPEVLSDLASLGFDADWGLLSASAVGAPHRRERFWLVAYTDREFLQQFLAVGRQSEHDQHARHDPDRPCGTDVGHACCAGRPEVSGGSSGDEGQDGRRQDGADEPDGPGEDVAVPESFGLPGRGGSARTFGQDRTSERANTFTQPERRRPRWRGFPPRPDDIDGWERWTTEGGPQPGVRRGPDGPSAGMDRSPARLHLLGNGHVPQCAAEAVRRLAVRALS